jgi:hypothetical protein
LAYRSVMNQVQQQEKETNEIRNDRNRSARSLLPVALSSVCRASAKNAKRHFPIRGQASQRWSTTSDEKQLVAYDESTIQTITDCIEFERGGAAGRLTYILAAYQVLMTRGSESSIDDKTLSESRDDYKNHTLIADTINWSVCYAIASSLFDYARTGRYPKTTNVSKADVESALRLIRIDDMEDEQFANILEARASSNRLEMDFWKDQ